MPKAAEQWRSLLDLWAPSQCRCFRREQRFLPRGARVLDYSMFNLPNLMNLSMWFILFSFAVMRAYFTLAGSLPT